MTTSINTTKVYDEIIEFIAAGTTPQSVVDFKLSDAAQERLEDLVYQYKTGVMTPEEKKELDNFLVLNHIMILAKVRSYKYIDAK